MPELVDGTGTSISASGSNISINSDLSDNTSSITIADAGTIGSVSDPDAISIAAIGDVSLTQDLSVTGDLDVSNIVVDDSGTIGSTSDTDAISIASTGDVSLTQDLSVAGDLDVRNITIDDAGTIGSVSDPDALSISVTGDLTLPQGISSCQAVRVSTLAPRLVPARVNCWMIMRRVLGRRSSRAV